MKTMINLLQLTVFLTKCYVLVIVSEKLNIYVNFQTIKSVINNYWPVLTQSQLLKLICFSSMCLLICPNIVEFMTVATSSEYAIWEMHWGWSYYFGLVDVWRVFVYLIHNSLIVLLISLSTFLGLGLLQQPHSMLYQRCPDDEVMTLHS